MERNHPQFEKLPQGDLQNNASRLIRDFLNILSDTGPQKQPLPFSRTRIGFNFGESVVFIRYSISYGVKSLSFLRWPNSEGCGEDAILLRTPAESNDMNHRAKIVYVRHEKGRQWQPSPDAVLEDSPEAVQNVEKVLVDLISQRTAA